MKQAIRAAVAKSAFLHYLYILYCTRKIRKKTNFRAVFLSRQGANFENHSEILRKVAARRNTREQKICHIIGSGWSLNSSHGSIDDDALIMGCNFSALLPLHYDFYFVEFGGWDVAEIAKRHLALVSELVQTNTDLVYFKNIWEEKNDIDFMSQHWANSVVFTKDFVVPCLAPEFLEQSLRYCLKESTEFVPQYCSTALTLIFIAFQSGFRNIVLHGIDFGGKYFFEDDDFDGDLTHAPPQEERSEYYSATKSSDQAHPTSHDDVGLEACIPVINKLLKERGATLFCATNKSPLSKYLPVYNDSKRALED